MDQILLFIANLNLIILQYPRSPLSSMKSSQGPPYPTMILLFLATYTYRPSLNFRVCYRLFSIVVICFNAVKKKKRQRGNGNEVSSKPILLFPDEDMKAQHEAEYGHTRV